MVEGFHARHADRRVKGEIWDLEKLAEVCEQQKRWSFFFTSAPLNIIGGVASPPNALCIF